MTAAAEAIRTALVCPRCKQRGTIRAQRERHEDAGGIAFRLICDGEAVEAKRCGVLGDFVPSDPDTWSTMVHNEAVAALQSFLDSTVTADSATNTLVLVRKDQRIEVLEEEIREMARRVHHAYHGAGCEADPCGELWTECRRGICRDAQRALGIEPSGG